MIDFILLFFLVVCAITAVRMKDLLSAIMILGAYSLIMAVVWTRMNAVDVAFTEASVGAGITSVLLLAALSRTQRREEDRRQGPADRRQLGRAEERKSGRAEVQEKEVGSQKSEVGRAEAWKDRRESVAERRQLTVYRDDAGRKKFSFYSILSFIIVMVTGAVLAYGTFDMPDYGDPDAPAHLHVANEYIAEAHEDTGVVNFVTAILAAYRGYDTLGETTVIFTAGICVVLLLRKRTGK